MSKYPNPLLKKKTENQRYSMTANAVEAASTPISPLSGEPMQKVFCRNVPVYVDLERRLVLPIKKGE